MQIQMNGFHRLLANSRPKVDKSAWQARRQMLSDEISIKRTSPVETTISPEARDMWKKLQEQQAPTSGSYHFAQPAPPIPDCAEEDQEKPTESEEQQPVIGRRIDDIETLFRERRD